MPRIKHKRGVISQGECRQLIEKCETIFMYADKTLQYQALISFLYLSGVRISEALMLTRNNFWTNEDGTRLIVKVPVVKTGARKKEGFVSERLIVIPTDSVEICFFSDLLFEWVNSKKKGEKIWNIDRRRAWEALKQLNPTVYLHLFRHTRASRFADKNISGTKAAAWFGWTSSATYDRYVHHSKRVFSELGDVLADD